MLFEAYFLARRKSALLVSCIKACHRLVFFPFEDLRWTDGGEGMSRERAYLRSTDKRQLL
jgi:hypothetical protein